jgi:putative heme-binding domain-containing protein
MDERLHADIKTSTAVEPQHIHLARRLLMGTVLCCLCAMPLPAADSTAPAEVAARRLQYERHALGHEGDPDHGRELFRAQERTKCLTCHKIGSEGGTVGPDLSHIGGKFDRPHLIESLLEPSRQIIEGYRVSVIALDDGQVVTGIVKEHSDDSLTLIDAKAESRVVRTSDIELRQESDLSLMPEGLADALELTEFTDLVAYLESLRPGGKPKPGEDVSGPITLPAGFETMIIATNLTGLTALETTRDGRIFVCEQTGALRVVKDGVLLEEPFVTLPVEAYWERGLIGVTVHPDFPEVPEVFVCYVAKDPYSHHRVSRFIADGDVAVPGSEMILLAGDDQSQLGGKVPAGHQGGALHFGPDGTLYIGGDSRSTSRHVSGKAAANQPRRQHPRRQPVCERGHWQVPGDLGTRVPQPIYVRLPGQRWGHAHQRHRR